MNLRNTTSSVVAGVLRDEIRRGELAPGTRLRQEEIAARLDVSTTPVREAFHVLRGQGLLELDPHRGVIVFRPTMQDVQESYEIRETLEAMAIAKAIPNLTPEAISQLQLILDEMKNTSDEQRWIQLNTLFHYSLYEYSGQKKLSEMIENLRIATNTYVHIIVRNARESGRADSGHQVILDACRDGDIRRAQEAVRAHLNNTVEQTIKLIQSLPSDESSS